jgi:hypothetical protein
MASFRQAEGGTMAVDVVLAESGELPPEGKTSTTSVTCPVRMRCCVR